MFIRWIPIIITDKRLQLPDKVDFVMVISNAKGHSLNITSRNLIFQYFETVKTILGSLELYRKLPLHIGTQWKKDLYFQMNLVYVAHHNIFQ